MCTMDMLDPEIARNVLSEFKPEDRPSILDAVRLGNKSQVELEVWGLFCSCLAWGGLLGKRNLLISFYENLPGTFTEFVLDPSQDLLKMIYGSNVGSLQLRGICLSNKDLLETHQSISEFVKESDDVVHAIFHLAHTLREKLDQYPPYSKKRKYNLPRVDSRPPQTEKGKKKISALKRFCMYFRWMVRDSKPDYGVWNFCARATIFYT